MIGPLCRGNRTRVLGPSSHRLSTFHIDNLGHAAITQNKALTSARKCPKESSTSRLQLNSLLHGGEFFGYNNDLPIIFYIFFIPDRQDPSEKRLNPNLKEFHVALISNQYLLWGGSHLQTTLIVKLWIQRKIAEAEHATPGAIVRGIQLPKK